MKCSRTATIGLLVAMTCWSRTSMAAYPNLLPNGTFDTDLSGWTRYGASTCSGFSGGVCWTSVDADDSPSSGSAHLRATRYFYPILTLTSECIPVTAGDDYVLDLFVRGGSSKVEASPFWFTNPACELPGRLETSVIEPGLGIWTHSRRVFAAPGDVVAVRVLLRAREPAYPYFDNVRLHHLIPGGTTTTLGCEGTCGDPLPIPEGEVLPTDAFYILLVAVGTETCAPCICDVNDDGRINAIDALLTLEASAGQPVSLTCPP
jgi:hypothetical protein